MRRSVAPTESGATRKEKLDEKSVLGTKPNGVGFKSTIVAAQTAS